MSKNDNIRLVPVGHTDDFKTAYGFDGWMNKSEWEEIWEKLVPFMRHVTINGDEWNRMWVTFHPVEVEKILGLSGEHTITARKEASERQRELRKSRCYFDKGMKKSW